MHNRLYRLFFIMLYRLQQFWSALFPHITAQESEFVSNYLNKNELIVFNKLPKSDRKHSIKIALHLSQKYSSDQILIRAALLHDIGKIFRPLNIFEKTIAVLLHDLSPSLALKLSKKENSIMDTYYNHPKKGAFLAEHLKLKRDLIFLIEHHHNPTIDNDRLQLLISTDNLY